MLEIQVNKEIVMEYDRNTRLPGKQREFLDKMDFDMDAGIYFDDKRYDNPDTLQRGKYVAMKLIQAFKANNHGMINAMCGYLTNRLPSLLQISLEERGEEVTINLTFDESK
jgi:hypothetical protein